MKELKMKMKMMKKLKMKMKMKMKMMENNKKVEFATNKNVDVLLIS